MGFFTLPAQTVCECYHVVGRVKKPPARTRSATAKYGASNDVGLRSDDVRQRISDVGRRCNNELTAISSCRDCDAIPRLRQKMNFPFFYLALLYHIYWFSSSETLVPQIR